MEDKLLTELPLSSPQPRSTLAAPSARGPIPSGSAWAAGVPGESAPWSPTRRVPTTRCCASRLEMSLRCWCRKLRTAGSMASWRARPREWSPRVCAPLRFPATPPLLQPLSASVYSAAPRTEMNQIGGQMGCMGSELLEARGSTKPLAPVRPSVPSCVGAEVERRERPSLQTSNSSQS